MTTNLQSGVIWPASASLHELTTPHSDRMPHTKGQHSRDHTKGAAATPTCPTYLAFHRHAEQVRPQRQKVAARHPRQAEANQQLLHSGQCGPLKERGSYQAKDLWKNL